MQSITVVPATSLELSFGCYLLGYYEHARVYRSVGRKACLSELETAVYDVTCGEFLKDPESYITNCYEGDLDELLDNTRLLTAED